MKNDPEKKKKLPFGQRLKAAFNGVSRRELMGVLKDTVKDLRKPKEIALLVGCSVVPGGWIGYGVYRVAKYRRKKAVNDNPEPPRDAPGQQPPVPKPPAP